MAFKCKIGLHSWNGCKCSDCGKLRNKQHDWSKDCEKCTKCGKINENQHVWSKDCEKCSNCGKTRENKHDWTKDCEKCSMCGKTRVNQHEFNGCKCSKCGKKRDNQHDWNGCKCSKCGKKRDGQHQWNGCKCSKCDKTRDEQHQWIGCKCSKCGKKRLKDIDGNFYNCTKVGNILWMADNLNVERFRNGDQIPEAKTESEWSEANKSFEPAYCYYNYDALNIKYGKFYNLFAIFDKRKIAPQGFRLPLDDDFRKLISAANNLTMHLLAVGEGQTLKLGEKVVLDTTGTNLLGFSALLAGSVSSSGFFEFFGSAAQFCSSEEIPNVGIKVMNLSDIFDDIKMYNVPRDEIGCTIRCVKE